MNSLPRFIVNRTGKQQAYPAVTVGLIIAYLIMCFVDSSVHDIGWDWILHFNYKLSLIIGAVVIYLTVYYFGSRAGQLIYANADPGLQGIFTGYFLLWSGVFTGGLVNFFQEGVMSKSVIDAFAYYIVVPIIATSLIGLIPMSLIGIWYGKSVQKKLLKLSANHHS